MSFILPLNGNYAKLGTKTLVGYGIVFILNSLVTLMDCALSLSLAADSGLQKLDSFGRLLIFQGQESSGPNL